MGMISVGRDNWRDLSVEVGITAVRTEEFVMIRQLLEMFKDFLILAEVCFSFFFFPLLRVPNGVFRLSRWLLAPTAQLLFQLPLIP